MNEQKYGRRRRILEKVLEKRKTYSAVVDNVTSKEHKVAQSHNEPVGVNGEIESKLTGDKMADNLSRVLKLYPSHIRGHLYIQNVQNAEIKLIVQVEKFGVN